MFIIRHDALKILEHLVNTSLEVTIWVTYPDMERAKLGIGKKIQILVKHLNNPNKTYAVLGNDIQEALRNAFDE